VIDEIKILTNSRMILMSSVDLHNAEYSYLHFKGPQDSRFTHGMEEYQKDLYRFDPTLRSAAMHPRGGFVTLSSSLTELGGDLDSRNYAKWMRGQLGIGNMMVRYTPQTDGLALGISAHPAVARWSHTKSETALFKMLFEHIENALRLTLRQPSYDELKIPIFFISKSGDVRRTTDAARSVLSKYDGLSIVDGKLVAADAVSNKHLQIAISRAINAITHGAVGGVVMVKRASGVEPWMLKVTCAPEFHEAFLAHGGGALVRMISSEQVEAGAARHLWSETFGLTPTECRVVSILLYSDDTLANAAEALGMRYSTARVHLRNVYSKTGTRGQLALARLLRRCLD
jgi:DNA-binding CsgD family transcriptional regulator